MLLENRYYRIIDRKEEGQDTVFRVSLLPDCDIYQGHFPGNPVCPGVCNIETVKECVEILTGKRLFIGFIRQCRLTAVASPDICPWVNVRINCTPAEEGFAVTAKMSDDERVYMEYKGVMKVL